MKDDISLYRSNIAQTPNVHERNRVHRVSHMHYMIKCYTIYTSSHIILQSFYKQFFRNVFFYFFHDNERIW